MDNVNFSVIIRMYGMEGMVALGKILHPTLGKQEVNLEHAQFTIDLLHILEEKTKGNLSQEEQRELSDTLSLLRLNYVQEKNSTIASIPSQQPPGQA